MGLDLHDSVKKAKSLIPPEACHQLAAGVIVVDCDEEYYAGSDLYCAPLHEGPGGWSQSQCTSIKWDAFPETISQCLYYYVKGLEI